jgi:hypothetical protein
MTNKHLNKFSDEVKGWNVLGNVTILASKGGVFIVVTNKNEEATIDAEFNLLGAI